MRKVFQKKFPTNADATRELDRFGWHYAGRKGLLEKYDLYTGVQRPLLDPFAEFYHYRLRLYKDGLVELYAESSKILSTSGLPGRVWESEDLFEFHLEALNKANETLMCNGYVLEDAGPGCYELYELHSEGGGIGKKKGNHPIQKFKFPTHAVDWLSKADQ